jgi:uncharacterized membrane protein YeaQ/YmgE (transglycosylase-associated protein family)
MDPVGIIVMLLVGAIAGWLAGTLFRGAGFGLLGNIIVGLIGAVIAGLLLPGVLQFGGLAGQIISAAIGAVILLFIVSLLNRSRV